MKIEKRGKYAGVKVHLEGDECKDILAVVGEVQHNPNHDLNITNLGVKFLSKLEKKMRILMMEEPTLLEERTEEEIKAALQREYEESQKKLNRLSEGKVWNNDD